VSPVSLREALFFGVLYLVAAVVLLKLGVLMWWL
jgi:hypothetical protein